MDIFQESEENIKNSEIYKTYVKQFNEYINFAKKPYDDNIKGFMLFHDFSLGDAVKDKILYQVFITEDFYSKYKDLISNRDDSDDSDEALLYKKYIFENDEDKAKYYNILIYIKSLVLEDFVDKIDKLTKEKEKLEKGDIFTNNEKIYSRFFIIQDIEQYIADNKIEINDIGFKYDKKNIADNKIEIIGFKYDKKNIETMVEYLDRQRRNPREIDKILYLYYKKIINAVTHSKIIINICDDVINELKIITQKLEDTPITNLEQKIHEYYKTFIELHHNDYIIKNRMTEKFTILINEHQQQQKQQEQQTAKNFTNGVNPLIILRQIFKPNTGGKKKYSCRRRVKKNTQKGKKKIKKTQKKN